ncbi:MAG: amidohydrolase family protein [Actinomycetales bacterium]|nr:amidohydrolase family protein [Actinomycetales bacterium]
MSGSGAAGQDPTGDQDPAPGSPGPGQAPVPGQRNGSGTPGLPGTSGRILLPGLVDLHVHLRDPGQTHKEDFTTGTGAALAGGFTTVLDMPNNATPVTTREVLGRKLDLAGARVVCDTGLYFGSLGDNLSEFEAVQDLVWGLKLYLNTTTGGYLLDPDFLVSVLRAWRDAGARTGHRAVAAGARTACAETGGGHPVLLHAEADVLPTVLRAAGETGQPVHVCHVCCRAELEQIIAARAAGIPVTCGVTPHHLFLSAEDADRLGPHGEVRPALRPRADVDYLWENLAAIDVVESDHAPHTPAEKDQGVFGFPGLETTLPLLLWAERQGMLRREDIVAKCHEAPARILGLGDRGESVVELDEVEFELGDRELVSRAAWTPFAGRAGYGRVRRVSVRGRVVFEDGVVLAEPGEGFVLRPAAPVAGARS